MCQALFVLVDFILFIKGVFYNLVYIAEHSFLFSLAAFTDQANL